MHAIPDNGLQLLSGGDGLTAPATASFSGNVSGECCAAQNPRPGSSPKKMVILAPMSQLGLARRAAIYPNFSSDSSHTGASRSGLKRGAAWMIYALNSSGMCGQKYYEDVSIREDTERWL